MLGTLTMSAYSQTCSRNTSTFVKAKGGYDIAGVATLKNENNQKSISLDNNFNTVSGPDLHIYLGTKNESPTSVGNKTVLISLLKSNSGQQSFSVHDSVDISAYDYVLIHCLAGNHFWGGGQLQAISGVCPIINGLDELNTLNKSVFFNKETKSLTINNVEKNDKIVIYNLLGNIIFDNVAHIENNLSNLSQGLYLGKYIDFQNNIASFKFIIE